MPAPRTGSIAKKPMSACSPVTAATDSPAVLNTSNSKASAETLGEGRRPGRQTRRAARRWPDRRSRGLAALAAFRFDNSFARELQGFYVPQRPAVVREPRLLFLNDSLAEELGLDLTSLDAAARAAIFAGNTLPDGAEPLAQAYAGHQFGGFSPQLGDGRALLLGEVIDRQGRRRDIAFKGSGRTPFARGGDGKAAVGPMLREVLISEAMHALGIPTTRALAVAATGEQVYREHALPGAVLTRVAASHIRVGTFRVLRRARRRGKRAQTGRVHDRAPRSRARDRAAAASWRCCSAWPSVRPR